MRAGVGCRWCLADDQGFFEQFRLLVDERWGVGRTGVGSGLVLPGGRYSVWLYMVNFLCLKRPLYSHSIFCVGKFRHPSLNWTNNRPNVGLGIRRPADFVCLFNFGIWFSIPEPQGILGSNTLSNIFWYVCSRNHLYLVNQSS